MYSNRLFEKCKYMDVRIFSTYQIRQLAGQSTGTVHRIPDTQPFQDHFRGCPGLLPGRASDAFQILIGIHRRSFALGAPQRFTQTL